VGWTGGCNSACLGPNERASNHLKTRPRGRLSSQLSLNSSIIFYLLTHQRKGRRRQGQLGTDLDRAGLCGWCGVGLGVSGRRGAAERREVAASSCIFSSRFSTSAALIILLTLPARRDVKARVAKGLTDRSILVVWRMRVGEDGEEKMMWER